MRSIHEDVEQSGEPEDEERCDEERARSRHASRLLHVRGDRPDAH
jgi:hypothetical protein